MYLSLKKVLIVLAIIVYLVFTWFLPIWIHLVGTRAWLLRLVMLGVGLVAFGIILWWSRGREKPAESSAAPAAGGPVPDEISFLIRAAQDKLRHSQVRGATIGALPAIFLIGESGSGKTAAVANSGLDPEHLAGRFIENGELVPTGSINLWFARQAIFAEAAGPLLNDPAGWSYVVRRLAPARLLSVLGGGRQASRAAVVCLDCETFTRSASLDSLTSAAKVLQSRLREASAILGASLPVYVLFTKADAVAFFAEYAATLNSSEAAQVLGVTLPVQDYRTGLYAQEQGERLTQAFDQLFYSLAHHRTEFLGREADPARWPGIYEFPREFRKLRTPLVQMLVELCRPSQLRAVPFLRGFYFTGVRMVLEEAVPAAARAPRPAAGPAEGSAGATQMFNLAALQQAAQAEQAAAGGFDAGRARWVPQWTFLSHIFGDLLLQDRVALGASGASTKVGFWRRFLLAAAAVIFVVCAVGFLVSFFGNRSLEERVQAAASANFATLTASQAPSATDLERLNGMGQLVSELDRYHQDSPPWSLRWGLYTGEALRPAACRAYARGFETLLLGPAQAAMVASLSALRFKSPYDPNADPWDDPYNTLETYLITTGDGVHAKEDPALASDLFAKWSAGRTLGTDQEALAKREFDFYSAELGEGNDCFDHQRDHTAVGAARAYLQAFPPEQRIYANMLLAASTKGGKGIDFDRDGYADAVVSDPHIIRPAFTKDGWQAMQVALANPDKYGNAAAWVLGAQSIADPQSYKAALDARYQKDFANEWGAFIRSARFRPLSDASRMVYTVGGARSALLMVLCLASEHTANTGVAGAFTAPRAFVPPNCVTNVLGQPNKAYTDSLFTLQGCLQKADLAPTPDAKSAARQACATTASDASQGVRQLIAQNSGSNPEVNTATQALLLDPIATLQGRTKAPPPPGAADLCGGLRTLNSAFPAGETALADFEGVFGPGGTLSKFKPPAENPNPRYASFYQSASRIQQALYPDGKTLHMRYTVTALPSQGVTSFTLSIGGQILNAVGASKQLAWTGSPQETVQLTVGALSTQPETGPLDIFRFVANNAEPGTGRLGPQGYTFSIRAGQTLGRQTTPGRLNLRIDAGAASVLFEGGWAARLGCTTKMTQ